VLTESEVPAAAVPLSETEQGELLIASRLSEHSEGWFSRDVQRFVVFNAEGHIFGTQASTQGIDDNSAYVDIYCGALEIMKAKGPADGLQRGFMVRQIVRGIEIIGWSPDEIDFSWGTNTCSDRTSDTEPLPPGYVAVDPVEARQYKEHLESARMLYLLDTEGCTSWRVENGEMIRTEALQNEQGNAVVRELRRVFRVQGLRVNVGGLYEAWMETDSLGNGSGGAGGVGCVAHFLITGGRLNEIHLIRSSHSAGGYCLEDVTILFTDKKACEAHYRTNPRVKTDSPSYRYVPRGMRVFKGC
jgi:hypothetical protein